LKLDSLQCSSWLILLEVHASGALMVEATEIIGSPRKGYFNWRNLRN
jgi:hypothetical protein